MKAFIGALFGIALASTVSGQTVITLTNADLNKPLVWRAPPASAEMLASLARNQFQPTPTYELPRQQVYATRQPANMSGPWDWPRPMPARRLDGTLLSQPPTVYGVPSYWPTYGNHVYGNPYPNPPQQRRRR